MIFIIDPQPKKETPGPEEPEEDMPVYTDADWAEYDDGDDQSYDEDYQHDIMQG